MSYRVTYLDGFQFEAERDFALACLRQNKAVACVEVWNGGECVERITR